MRNERMYSELLELITTDSASGKETAIAELLMAKLEALGFTVIMDNAGELTGGECGNVFGYLDGQLDGSVLFSSHMDRVPNGCGIKPVERDGILYSDGTTILAADDLAGVCAILEGIRQAKESGKPLPRLEVIFTVSEEIALDGSRAFDISRLQSKVGYVVDATGHAGRIVNAAPGRYQLGAEVTGLAAHAGNAPERGIDAAKLVCEIIAALPTGLVDSESTANFPNISTGTTARNVVCDFAQFKGEGRSRNKQKLLDYVELFKETCTRMAAEKGAGIKLDVEESYLPFCIDQEEETLVVAKAACEKLGLPFHPEAGGGGMDANIYNAHGLSTVGVAAGYSKNHTKDEQLDLAEFFKVGNLVGSLIETYAETRVSK